MYMRYPKARCSTESWSATKARNGPMVKFTEASSNHSVSTAIHNAVAFGMAMNWIPNAPTQILHTCQAENCGLVIMSRPRH